MPSFLSLVGGAQAVNSVLVTKGIVCRPAGKRCMLAAHKRCVSRAASVCAEAHSCRLSLRASIVRHHKAGIQRFGTRASIRHAQAPRTERSTHTRQAHAPTPSQTPPFCAPHSRRTPTTLIPRRVQGGQAKFTLIIRSRARYKPATRGGSHVLS